MKGNVGLGLLYALRLSLLIQLALTIFESITEAKANTVCESAECIAAAKIFQDSIDTKVNPCDDFYRYACGNWPVYHENKKVNESSSTLALRQTQTENEIRDFLQQNNSEDEPKSIHKIREFYSVCLDPESYNGTQIMDDIYSAIGLPIDPWKSNPNPNFDYISALAKAHRIAGMMLFEVYVNYDPLADWRNSIWLRMPLVYATTINSTKNDLTSYTFKTLQSITDNIAKNVNSSLPKFNWTRYIEEIFGGLENVTLDLKNPSNDQIFTIEMAYIRDTFFELYKKNISTMEKYLWNLTHSYLLALTNDTFNLQPALSNKTTQPKENYCLSKIMTTFGHDMGYMYLKQKKYKDAIIEVDGMVKDIKKSYEKILKQASWMDQKTTEKALIKLASMKSLIAYPSLDELNRISNKTNRINITRSYLESIISIVRLSIEDNLNKLNQINNSTSQNWPEPAITVNAWYMRDNNCIVIPAGILGPPIYITGLKALIYGSIGFIMAHEISHGFDNNGRRFNAEGEFENWWNDVTAIKFEKKAACFVEAYGKYNATFQGIYEKIDSKITLNEDIADNAGFRAALLAYREYVSEKGTEPLLKNIENYTSEQLLTLVFAHGFCQNRDKNQITNTSFDDHSPAEVRVNGVLRNSYEFSSIWNCPKGTNMNPCEDKCIIF